MKKDRIMKKGVARSWLLSYIFILALPLLITGFLFWGMERIVYAKITSMNEAILNQIKGTLDNMFESVYKSTLQIQMSEEVNQVLEEDLIYNDSAHYRMHILQDYLTQYVMYSDYVEDVAVYLRDSNYVVSSKSSYDPGLWEEFLKQYALTGEDWKSISQVTDRGFYILNGHSAGEGRMVCLAPVPIAAFAEKRGMVVVFLKEKYFNQKVSNDLSQNRVIYLARDDMMMALTENSRWAGYQLETALSEKEKEGLSRERKGLIVLSTASDTTNLQYVVMERYQEVYRELQIIRILILGSIGISMGLGIWCAVYFTKKNYHPMNELISSVSRNLDVVKEYGGDEYAFLHNAMETAIKGRQEAEKQIAVVKMLRGYSVSESLKKKYFSEKYYIVAAFAVEDARGFFQGEGKVPDNFQLLSFVISNCCKDFYGEKAAAFDAVELDRYLVQIFCLEDKPEKELRQQIWNQLEAMHKFFNSSLQIKLSASLGNICYGAEMICGSYEKAKEALEYRMLMGNNVLIDTEHLSEFALFYEYSIESEKDIMNSLKSGNFAQARDLVFQVIDNNVDSGMMSAQLARCMLFDLAGTIIKALSLIRLDNNFLGQLNPVERLFQCETFDEMKKEISDILENVCDYINQNREDPNRKLFSRITTYAEEHYMDENLNVSSLASDLYVSKTFLVKLFKDYMGTTPLDYINRLRCERAAVMLGNQDRTVEEIAGRVGYANVHSFIRVFKKLYGRTPGAYRTMLIDEGMKKREGELENES